MFRLYCGEDITWEKASVNTSMVKGYGESHARTLRTWGRACLLDSNFIPRTSYGKNHDPLIEYEEFEKELAIYLRSAGKFITAATVVQFTAQPTIQEEWGLTSAVSQTTARRWLHVLEYRWGREPTGMYIDGHERPDVVEYRQKKFLRAWKEFELRMESFAAFEITHMDPIIRRIVAWFHDESTFHENDRRMLVWILISASRAPVKKGEGRSLMVSDVVSAEHGWMSSPDG
jgi:hypothetical protein